VAMQGPEFKPQYQKEYAQCKKYALVIALV
jgi:hypothetical protein